MDKLLRPLNDNELAALDQFLLDRIDANLDDDDDDVDEELGDVGLVSVSGLDGLFTALISGPVLPAPEQWLPVVWGDYEPEWEDAQDFEARVELMMRHLNTIAATLQEAPQEFDPLFLEDEEDGETFLVVDDWCEGYTRGVALSADRWRKGGATVEQLLHPIVSFSSATEWQAHELEDEREIEKLSEAITPSVRALYAYWQEPRRSEAAKPEAASKPSPWDNSRKK
ncbi:MAG: hypothetical protein RLZZ227_1673 [Pseudomonadota bacterium]|jgi:uncharacterized protein